MSTSHDPVAKATWSTIAPHVVVAEDNDDERCLLVDALERDGCRVTAICDGERLLDLLSSPGVSLTVDLVVSDVCMPVFSGLEVLGALQPSVKRAPWLLITAMDGDDVLQQARDVGAVGVLRKPFGAFDFRLAVRMLLEHSHRARARRR